MHNNPIVIVGAARTPIGNFLGELQNVTATQLGAIAIQGALKRCQLDPTKVNEVYMGCVLPAGLGQAPARQAALGAGLAQHTGAVTINKVCGSSLKAAMIAHDTLLTDNAEIIIAGGMESMSNAPYLLPKARTGYRIGQQKVLDHMMHDGLEDAYEQGKSMGYYAEQCAKQFHFTRTQQDEFALRSLQHAQQATADGSFKKEIEPVLVKNKDGEHLISTDEAPQKAKAEKIPLLKPAFAADGTVTAANSSSISDGAAALILMRQNTAQQYNLKPLATIVGHATHAQAAQEFTTAPIGAIKKLLEKINWSVNDVDLFEINEAFAVVVLAAMQTLKLPLEKINIHGGSCALGHPIGASGARVLTTLIYALQQRNLKRGIATLCLGGGEAVAMAVTL